MVRWIAVILSLFFSINTNAQNLIQNPDCEFPLVNGKIPFWTEVLGQKWTQGKTDPSPQNGQNYFFAGVELEAELSQVIVLNNDLCKIDRGGQSFQFEGYVRAYPQTPPDQSQIIIEMLNSNSSILQSYDLGIHSTTDRWTSIVKTMNAPPQTRKIKVRLLSHRKNGSDNDGYFDNLKLIPTVSSNNNSNTISINQSICQGQSFLGYKTSGSYIDTLKTANGCDSIRTLRLSVIELPKINFNNTKTICSGRAVELIPNLTPSTLPVTYKWSTGATTPGISVVQAGTYELTVSNGACSVKSSTSVLAGTPPVVKPNETICLNSPTLRLEAGATGQNLSYLWTPTNTTSATLNISQIGKYQVRVTSPDGCESTRTIDVLAAPQLELGSNKTMCEGESITLVPVINDTGGVVYRWNTGATTSSLNVNQSGVYKLTVSQASCTAIDSVEVRVNSLPLVLPDETTCQDKPLIAGNTDSNLTYLWETSGERSREITVVEEGVYRVKITNQFGCSKTRTFTVSGPCSASISAPDRFTPNGDGINDTFKLFISGGTPVKLIIYNRWGNPVFSSTDSNPEWDGKLNGWDMLNGRYAYVLDYKTLTNSAIQKYWGVIHIER